MLQQQKITSGSIPVSQQHETEPTVCTGSSELDRRRLEKCHRVFFQSSAVQCPGSVPPVHFKLQQNLEKSKGPVLIFAV